MEILPGSIHESSTCSYLWRHRLAKMIRESVYGLVQSSRKSKQKLKFENEVFVYLCKSSFQNTILYLTIIFIINQTMESLTIQIKNGDLTSLMTTMNIQVMKIGELMTLAMPSRIIRLKLILKAIRLNKIWYPRKSLSYEFSHIIESK